MKTLYFECNMGAAGDMLMSALYDICEQKELFLTTMNQLFSPDIKLTPLHVTKNGIMGTQMQVLIHEMEEGVYQVPSDKHKHDHSHADSITGPDIDETEHHHHHHHVSYSDILGKIDTLALPDTVKENASSIYKLIGEAEAKVHGTTIQQIHFHEVGTLDALVDVVGCSYLIYLIAPDVISCSPIHVGSGFVHCAHGVLPVPAPATAEILKGVPYYSGSISSELCTPTGAAILKYFAKDFVAMPAIAVSAIGYGMGHKDFPIANCVRAFSGKSFDNASSKACSLSDSGTSSNKSGTALPMASNSNDLSGESLPLVSDLISGLASNLDDYVLEISCNLDDMTGEAIGFATELLMDQGALDVYTVSVQMKKNRPGILFVCYCKPEDKDKFTELIFMHTSTRGMRYQYYGRAKLESETIPVTTPYGKISMKKSSGYGISHEKPEFEDVKAAALKHNVSLSDVYASIKNL